MVLWLLVVFFFLIYDLIELLGQFMDVNLGEVELFWMRGRGKRGLDEKRNKVVVEERERDWVDEQKSMEMGLIKKG